jgi:hypothetical protein
MLNLQINIPNIVVEWLTLLLRIWEVLDSNLGLQTGYHKVFGVIWFSGYTGATASKVTLACLPLKLSKTQ